MPADALLLIEVADSSLAWDRNVKIPMYGALAWIESWLVDIEHRTFTVFRVRDPKVPVFGRGPRGSRQPGQLPDIAIRAWKICFRR